METERYVTMEHHQQQPFARKQKKESKILFWRLQEEEKQVRMSKEKRAMLALGDIVAEEERKEVEGKQCIEKE